MFLASNFTKGNLYSKPDGEHKVKIEFNTNNHHLYDFAHSMRPIEDKHLRNQKRDSENQMDCKIVPTCRLPYRIGHIARTILTLPHLYSLSSIALGRSSS